MQKKPSCRIDARTDDRYGERNSCAPRAVSAATVAHCAAGRRMSGAFAEYRYGAELPSTNAASSTSAACGPV